MSEETKKECALARIEINELEARINSDAEILSDIPNEEEFNHTEEYDKMEGL